MTKIVFGKEKYSRRYVSVIEATKALSFLKGSYKSYIIYFRLEDSKYTGYDLTWITAYKDHEEIREYPMEFFITEEIRDEIICD